MDRSLADTRALHESFLHFFHLDHSNAAIHMAPVRYSPITFRLAEALSHEDRVQDLCYDGLVGGEVAKVMADRGVYPEDTGR
jgi:hypothetical protein